MGELRKIDEAAGDKLDSPGGTNLPRQEFPGQETQSQCALATELHSRNMLENASVGLCTIDGAGFFLACNPHLLNMLGYTYEELTALTILDVTHPDDRDISKRKLEELFEGRVETYQAEKRYIRKDGSVIWADDTGVAVEDRNDRPGRIVVTLFDITRRREDESELKSNLKVAEQARADTENAGRAKNQLLSNMKHELRTPLNVIIGYSQLLQDHWADDLNDKQICYIKEISEASRHLLQAINDVLDLEKLDCVAKDIQASNAVSTSSGNTGSKGLA